MAVHRIIFGHDLGQPVHLFTLRNASGLQVSIMNYGATITKILIPDRNGDLVQVVCGFDKLSDYLSDFYQSINPYFGATIGRYANRIANGQFRLEATTYHLSKNFRDHHLHGGDRGFDKHIWSVAEVNDEKNELRLRRKSDDMEEGYPGNLEVEVIFQLSESNELSISYRAVADQPTVVSMSNHTYFNLSGFRSNIESHVASINSNEVMSISDCLGKNGVTQSVQNTPFDLRHGVDLKRIHSMLRSGIDHYFLFNMHESPLKEVAEFHSVENGLKMKVSSDAPGAQFYTAAQLSNQLSRNENEKYGPMMAFCFECHEYPNGPNRQVPRGLLEPHHEYRRKTILKFDSLR